MSHALLQAWEKTVRRHGNARAVIQAADGRSVTFRELDAGASAWRAAQFPDKFRLQGRAVVFATANGIGWFEIFIGLLKAGAVAVPLDAAEPPVAQRQLAESLRAGFWWDGTRLVALPGAKRFRDPAICMIKLTSGSTGRPRPLVFTAVQLLADARQVTATMKITARDLNYALIPLGHSYGLGNLVIPLLAMNVPLVCGSAPLPHAISADFARWRPTVFPGVPVLWRALIASDGRLDSLRLGISAGAPLLPDVAREFVARFGQRLHSFYGSSETGGIAYDRSGRATLAGGVGPAMHGVRLQSLRAGRLAVTSPAVFTQGNRRSGKGTGSWLMADWVAINRQGGLTLLGRRGKTVKIGGRRVNLAEVCARIRGIPAVQEVWVGANETGDGQLGAAVISSRPLAELRTALHADTAAWKIPKKWILLSEFPLTDRGKVDVRALQKLLFNPSSG